MNEVDTYAAEVRAAFADLPPDVRETLLEDLPEHLAEVAAEADEPLRSRLGDPSQYAAELRATVELGQPVPRPARLRWADALDAAMSRLRAVDRRVGPLIGYAKVSDYLRLLRPGWWLLRGYLAAMAFVYAFDFSGPMGLLPRVAGNAPAGFMVLAGFMAGSIWLGRHHDRLRPWARYTLGAASVYFAIVAIVGFATVDHDVIDGGGGAYYPVVDNSSYDNVQDIFPYDPNGRLLDGVRLFDQDGNRVTIGSDECEPYDEPSNVYPRCPEQAPFTFPGNTPTSGPSLDASASPTATR